MKTCEQCGIEKELDKFYYNKGKNYYDVKCKVCRLSNKKNNPNSKKTKGKKEVNYRKVKSLIQPTIPLKKCGDDGYGGKWNFDIEQLNKDNEFIKFARFNGLKNHMSKSRIPCWQVKSYDLAELNRFCSFIGMDKQAVIEFGENDNKRYVVNLYHQDIVKMLT